MVRESLSFRHRGGLLRARSGRIRRNRDAVYDHTVRRLDDPIPRKSNWLRCSLADKLDSIVGCFAVGGAHRLERSHALRRAAVESSRSFWRRSCPFAHLAIGGRRKALLAHKPKRGLIPDQESQILEFIPTAPSLFSRTEGFGYDEVSAVFRAGADDLVTPRNAWWR